jgi:hypothetical protein
MARNNLQELEAIVNRFFKKVSLESQPESLTFRLTDFCNVQGDIYKRYAGWAGVYYLYSDDGDVHYVGQGTTLKWGVGFRVLGNAAKFKLIEKPGMNVGIIAFGEPDLCFALALECFLIRGLSPPCNKLGKSEVGSEQPSA